MKAIRSEVEAAVERTMRQERARILATLLREFGDMDLCEDAFQDALLQASSTWTNEGIPKSPAAWTLVVARRRAIDSMRKCMTREGKETSTQDESAARLPAKHSARDAEQQLALLFACCRSSLAPKARMALALRAFLGLSTREIARAFLERESSTAQTLVRAKKQLKTEGENYRLPASESQKEEAMQWAMTTLYLLFNEGYLAAEGDSLHRVYLSDQAIELTRLLIDFQKDHAEARGLLALMIFQHARRDARRTSQDEMVLLDDQDRSLWKQGEIEEAQRILNEALALRKAGPLQIQAAIASLHCAARTPQETDWPQIALLYRRLLQLQPSAVVELNATVALAMASGVGQGLARINQLERRGDLASYYLLYAVKADFLRKLGYLRQAIRYYAKAKKLCKNEVETRFLARRLAECRAQLAEISVKKESPSRGRLDA